MRKSCKCGGVITSITPNEEGVLFYQCDRCGRQFTQRVRGKSNKPHALGTHGIPEEFCFDITFTVDAIIAQPTYSILANALYAAATRLGVKVRVSPPHHVPMRIAGE